MKVNEFTGGLNTKIDPSLLPANAAVNLVSADIASGVLTAMRAQNDVPNYPGVSTQFIQHKGSIISSAQANAGFTEYANDLWYISGADLTHFRNGVTYKAGLAAPTTPVTLGINNAPTVPTSAGQTTTESAKAYIGVVAGDFPLLSANKYKILYYNDGGVAYGLGSETTYTLIGTADAVKVDITNGPAHSFAAEVYREYSGTYRKVGSLFQDGGTLTDMVYDISASSPLTFSGSSNETVVAEPRIYEVRKYTTVGAVKLYSEPVDLISDSLNVLSQAWVTIIGPNNTDEEVLRVYTDPVTKEVRRYIVPYQSTGIPDFTDYLEDPSTLYTLTTITERPNGTYQYVATLYNTTTGYESKPYSVTIPQVTVINGIVTVSSIPLGAGSTATHVRIYRVGGAITAFTRVVELTIGTISYLDIESDTAIDGQLLISNDYGIAPSNLTLLTEANGVLLGAVGSKLYFSKQGLVFAWPAENFIDFNTTVTCIAESVNGIVVATALQTYVITGNSPETYSKYPVSGEQGCQYSESVQKLKNGVILKSATALTYTRGGAPELLTEKVFNPLNIFIKSSAVHNNTYYAVGLTDIFVYNLTDNNYYTIGLTCDSIGVVDDAVHVLIGGSLYELFTSVGFLAFNYKSPVFTESAHSELKTYKNLYMAANGTFTVKLYLDDVLRATKTFTTSGIETVELKFPQKYQRAVHSQIEIIGVGTVYEYEFKTLGRQNGR